jgi:pimeloyl-ACP methyl ester carboxylesterase
MKRWTAAIAAGIAGLALARPPRHITFPDLAALLDGDVGGECLTSPWRHGEISYRVAGQGAPLLLLHGIDAAASSFEMRHNVAALGESFRVYAPDLLGFGLSDRPRLRYSPETYAELIADFLRDVVGEPAHVVASSLTGAFAIRAAHAHAASVRTLTLICPTGIERQAGPPTFAQHVAYMLFSAPLLGPRLFALLTSRPSMRYYLRSIAYHQRSRVTPDVVEAYHRSGQRPGARWAPRAFVGGRLNLNIADHFATLRQPILLVWGRQAKTTPLDTAPAFLERNSRAVLKVFDNAGLVPHDEQAEAFNDYLRTWIKEQEA